MPVTKITPSQCLWPGCNERPNNLIEHMAAVHGVTVNQAKQTQPTIARANATAPRQLSSVQAETNFTPDTIRKRSIGRAVRCLDCGSLARIIKQAEDQDGNVRRRRECPNCLTRFTTYEMRFAE